MEQLTTQELFMFLGELYVKNRKLLEEIQEKEALIEHLKGELLNAQRKG